VMRTMVLSSDAMAIGKYLFGSFARFEQLKHDLYLLESCRNWRGSANVKGYMVLSPVCSCWRRFSVCNLAAFAHRRPTRRTDVAAALLCSRMLESQSPLAARVGPADSFIVII
jgi:hypothetical protein